MIAHHRPMSAVSTAALLLVALSGRAADTPDRRDGRELRIRAEHLALDPTGETIVASGHVRLEVGELVLESGSALVDLSRGNLELGPPLRLRVGDALVEGSRLFSSAASARLEIDDPLFSIPTASGWELELSADSATCTEDRCQLSFAVGTGCPHQPAAYRVRAEEVTIHPSGDVDLRRASLQVGETTVAALPWLRVRPPHAAGFLPPRLAWDSRGGLILGPAGQIPLSDDLVLSGHAAVRTAQGFETSSTARTRSGQLTVDQLFDAPSNHFRSRFHLSPPLAGATLVVDGDIVDGKRIIDDLEFDPLERARTHTSTRALLSSGGGDFLLVESRLELVQGFDDWGRLDRDLHTPSVGVAARLLPVTLAGPIWPGVAVELTRRDTMSGVPAPDGMLEPAPEHTAVTANPSLGHSMRYGPLAAEIEIGSLHQIWLPDRTGWSRISRHVFSASTEVSLPLIGAPLGLRHAIAPLARYRVTPWIEGSAPPWTLDELDHLRRAHGVEAGLDTSLGTSSSPDALHLAAYERVDLPGLEGSSGPAYLYVSAAAGPRWLRLSADGSWDHRESLPSSAVLTLTTADDRGNRLQTGGSWYSPGNGAHLDRAWGTGSGPWIASPWSALDHMALELIERATVAITSRLRASAGALVGVVPDPRLHALVYGLEFGSSCGCLVAGIVASHRLGSWAPDVMATISLGAL